MADVIRYTITLTIDRPVGGWTCDETPDEHAEAAEWMAGREAKREIEREVLRALRVLDGDADCEVTDTERITEDGPENIADTGVDTRAEYRGER